ncbi:MAG: DUF1858 domain-containing protein [Lachnospiraceae bacterium]|nr:DUF1858 domain-containing protein [Lachnospiraceae bacterium]
MSIKDILFGSEEEKAADEQKAGKEGDLITKDMMIVKIISEHPGAADFLMSCGMGCIFCPSAQMESLEQAAMVHGLDADDICDALNDTLKKNAAAAPAEAV